MLRKSTVVALVITAALALPARAQELERTVPLRSFDRFAFDSGTVDGFWAEAGGVFSRASQGDGETAFARLAYGGSDKWEADLLAPYDFAGHDNGIGDIQVSAKYVPVRSQLLDLGIGALLSLPSGDDKKGFGTGEFGGAPFVTGTMHLAVVEVGGYVGAEFFTGSNKGGQAANRIPFGFDLIAPIGKYVALRNEFAGTDDYDVPNSTKAVSYEPGIDIRIPIGDLDILLRPTGAIGITEAAPSWGVGGSIVITSPTMRAPVGAAGPGGVTIE